MIASHTLNDGLLFTDPFVATSSDYTTYLQSFFPNINEATLEYINNKLYPAVYDGSQGYTSQYGRTNATIGETAILCNAKFLQNAYIGKSWGYNYVVQPAIHASDLYPTFYPNEVAFEFPTNGTLAVIMQTYFTNFAVNGNPNAAGVPNWPLAGNGVVMDFGDDGVVASGDTTPAARCAWWQKAAYA